MKRNWIGSLIFVIALLIAGGCSSSHAENDVHWKEERFAERQQVIELPQFTISPIDEMVERMTTEEKVGQLVIAGIEGTSFSAELEVLIKEHYVGGVILLGRNISTVESIVNLLNESKKANELNKVPLFLSVDEEGGRVSRLPNGVGKLPSARSIGALNDAQANYDAGIYLSEVLHEFGYNMNFAPVLDVFSNPKNTVIGDRSYGSDPAKVAKLGISTMHGMMDGDMIPVVKHFPGHGDTIVDSHDAMPVVKKEMEELKRMELYPFQQAIDDGAEAVMVSHVLYSDLDDKRVASLSDRIMSDLLRTEMGFDGVIITDDLTMSAISNDYAISDAAVQSFKAGSDVLLIAGDFEEQLLSISKLLGAIESGEISEARLNESVERILSLKYKYIKDEELQTAFDVKKVNELYEEFMRHY